MYYLSEILSFFVAITLVAGYVVYYKSVKNGVRPNTTLWTIWTFGSLIELWNYAVLSGDWVKNILPLVCAITGIVLYISFLSKGKFQKLTRENILIIILDFSALGLWYVTESALVANLALQVSSIISFIPIYREIYDEEENEIQLPWAIWSFTYFLSIIVVLLRWEKWGDLAYPVTNFVLHFLMWLLIYLHFYRGKPQRKNLTLSPNVVEKHLFVAKSHVAGKGVFTSKKILKNQTAFILKGKIFHFSPKNKEEALLHPNIFGIDKELSIIPIFPYDHVNHSCEPNLAILQDAVTFVALRDIEFGEELTFDYSISEHSDWEMDCSCSSSKCRKVIRSIENLPPDHFAMYYPNVPSYFEKVYFEKYIKDNP